MLYVSPYTIIYLFNHLFFKSKYYLIFSFKIKKKYFSKRKWVIVRTLKRKKLFLSSPAPGSKTWVRWKTLEIKSDLILRRRECQYLQNINWKIISPYPISNETFYVLLTFPSAKVDSLNLFLYSVWGTMTMKIFIFNSQISFSTHFFVTIVNNVFALRHFPEGLDWLGFPMTKCTTYIQPGIN